MKTPSKHQTRSGQSGVTIIEMMLVCLVTGIIFSVVQFLLARTIENWWKVNANADAQQQLYKAQNYLERDLRSAAFELEASRATISVEKAPTELVHLAGADSDVLWFLSAVDPVTGEFQRDPSNGEPLWQRNILYYAVTPTNLGVFDFSGPGLDAGGYEVSCPFKVLIRKEIDVEPDPSIDEPLLTYTQIVADTYLQRPSGLDVSGMAAPNVAVRPVSGNIATFRVDLLQNSRGVEIDLRATAIDKAKREGGIGGRDLANDPASLQLKFTAYPPNRQGLP